MALNKKEKAHLESVESKLMYQRQLTETLGSLIQPEVKPDVLPHGLGFMELCTGWLYNAHNKMVVESCSSEINHSFGRTDKTTTQGSVEMYSSELLAMKAMRREIVGRLLDEVIAIDISIKAMEAKHVK